VLKSLKDIRIIGPVMVAVLLLGLSGCIDTYNETPSSTPQATMPMPTPVSPMPTPEAIATPSPTPVPYDEINLNHVLTIEEYPVISAGGTGSFAIKADGSLWAWGANNHGQLGDGTRTDRLTPVKIMDEVVDVAADPVYFWYYLSSHAFAIISDKSLWAWGTNAHLQLGDGTGVDRLTPVKVMDDVVAISTGITTNLILMSDGSLWTWGYRYDGDIIPLSRAKICEFSNNDEFDYRSGFMDDVVSIKTGHNYSLVLKSDGSVWTESMVASPTRFKQIMDGVTAISVGGNHSMVVKNDNSLWTWGSNHFGQLGSGSTEGYGNPSKIMDDVIAISAGLDHSLAITNDGSLWGWGYGAIVNGSDGNVLTPVKIMSDVVAASAGMSHSLAVTGDGSLWAWGDNSYGQIGDNTITVVEVIINEMDEWDREYKIVTNNNRASPVKIMDGMRLP
jgi:alpha-tubulin suppressor-like RCC1 family protein